MHYPHCARVSGRGQALVEFALVLPLLMFLLLGFGEVAFLVATQHRYQNSADVLAQSVAIAIANGPGWEAAWDAVVHDEQARVDCAASPGLAVPEGTDPGDRVLVTWRCDYHAKLISGLGVPITVESVAVIPFIAPPPTPTPTPVP